MRKTIFFFVIAVLLFSILASCGKNTSTTPTATRTPNATQTAIEGLPYTSFASVSGGTFTQTDTANTANAFASTVPAFMIGKYQVTYDLWYSVYQWAVARGYAFQNAGTEGGGGTAGAVPTAAKYQPATGITWRDAVVWCNAYSEMTGRTPIYCADAGFSTPIRNSSNGANGSSINTSPGSFDSPYVNWNANGYRLPTESEWECAARYADGSNWTPMDYASGDTAPYYSSTTIGDYCWDNVNSGMTTHDVGGKLPNALGIYDMSGNVSEWCWDWYGTYPGTSRMDYSGPLSGSGRMVRGGSITTSVNYLETGSRDHGMPYFEIFDLGFRLARTR